MSRIIFFIGWMTLGLVEVQLQEVDNYEKQLYQYLTRSHPSIRPPSKHGDSVQVQLGLDLSHIISLEEKTEILSVNAWMKFMWDNPQFQWDPKNYGDIDVIHMPDSAIWKPDITLYNSAEASKFHPYGNAPVLVMAGGLILWVPPVTLHSICPVDLHRYPFDEHTCELRFGSWTYDVVKLNLTLFALDDPQNLMTQHFEQNNEWELVETSVSRSEKKYDCCPEVYPSVQFNLRLRRRSSFYKYTLIIPCLITMILTLVLFWLPPMAGEKTLLGGVNCILLLLLLNHLSWHLPNNGITAPAVVIFCGNSLVFTALSLILSISTITISRSHLNCQFSQYLVKRLDGILGKILCLTPTTQSKQTKISPDAELLSTGNIELNIEQPEISISAPDSNHQWIVVATALDRIFFFFYCLIYIIIFISVII